MRETRTLEGRKMTRDRRPLHLGIAALLHATAVDMSHGPAEIVQAKYLGLIAALGSGDIPADHGTLKDTVRETAGLVGLTGHDEVREVLIYIADEERRHRARRPAVTRAHADDEHGDEVGAVANTTHANSDARRQRPMPVAAGYGRGGKPNTIRDEEPVQMRASGGEQLQFGDLGHPHAG